MEHGTQKEITMTDAELKKIVQKAIKAQRRKYAKTAFSKAIFFLALMFSLNLLTGTTRPLWLWIGSFIVLSFGYYSTSVRNGKKRTGKQAFVTTAKRTAVVQISPVSNAVAKQCKGCGRPPNTTRSNSAGIVYCPRCEREATSPVSLRRAISTWNLTN